jgi:hypothetical protein
MAKTSDGSQSSLVDSLWWCFARVSTQVQNILEHCYSESIIAPNCSANNQLVSGITPARTGHDGCCGVGWSNKNGEFLWWAQFLLRSLLMVEMIGKMNE